MLIQPTRKIGVLGVLGVPESLKASNDAAYSDGTQTVTGRNTWCTEHELCSIAGHKKADHFSPPLPDGRFTLGSFTAFERSGMRSGGDRGEAQEKRDIYTIPSALADVELLISRISHHWSMTLDYQPCDPSFVSPATRIAIELEQMWHSRSGLSDQIQSALAHALNYALLAERQPLTDADLGNFGWQLTKLLAFEFAPIEKALSLARKAGGTASGQSRRAATSERDALICAEGRRLIRAGVTERDLVGAIHRTAKGYGLSTKTIRRILRAGNVKGT